MSTHDEGGFSDRRVKIKISLSPLKHASEKNLLFVASTLAHQNLAKITSGYDCYISIPAIAPWKADMCLS